MNRQELKLADQDGQIWMQLMAIRSKPSSDIINKEDTHNIIKKLGAALQLDGENATRLPRRLSVIIRNELWSPFTTSWCRTAIGKETFNASKWINIMSQRLDHVGQGPPTEYHSLLKARSVDSLQGIRSTPVSMLTCFAVLDIAVPTGARYAGLP